MFKNQPKLKYFIYGLLVGSLSGGILVYYNSVITNQNKISVDLIPQIVKQVIGVINHPSGSKVDSTLIKNENQLVPSNTVAAAKEQIEKKELQVLPLKTVSDTLPAEKPDTLDRISKTEEIVIKKDEQIAKLQLTVIVLEPLLSNKTEKKSDSLLAVVSGTKEEPKKVANYKIDVEFWRSPLNYRGYKASKNKLIFYSINLEEEIKLFAIKGALYLRYKDQIFALAYGNDFAPFDRVSDALIINQINKYTN